MSEKLFQLVYVPVVVIQAAEPEEVPQWFIQNFEEELLSSIDDFAAGMLSDLLDVPQQARVRKVVKKLRKVV